MPLWQQPEPSSTESDNGLVGWPEVWLAGGGLCCVAGDQPFALFGAVGARLTAARPDPVTRIRVPDSQEEKPLMTAPVAELGELASPTERIGVLAGQALADAVESLPEDFSGEKLLVCTLLPDGNCARGAALDLCVLERNLRSLHPRLQASEFRFLSLAAGTVGHLMALCRELASGDWQAVMFGGVDSLVDNVSCQELVLAGRLVCESGNQGLIPGEAAAFVTLLAKAPEMSKAANRPIRISAAAQVVEANIGQADRQPVIGLGRAIEQVLAHSNCSREDLGAVISPFAGDISSSLEWYQTQLWSWSPHSKNALAEAQSESAVPTQDELQELSLATTCGEIGAASLPVALLLASARFDFIHPPVRTALVCAAGQDPWRGAVLLEGSAGG